MSSQEGTIDMDIHDFVKDYRPLVSSNPERYYKTTLFENDAILVGINCFESQQCMAKHAHAEQNRFYTILEGTATVWLDDLSTVAVPGEVVFIPAGHAHKIQNNGITRLVVLVGIAPAHAD
jgi:quercetin dioxygenase-like cupin family protein